MNSLIKFCAQDLIFFVGLLFVCVFFKLPKKQRPQLVAATILAIIVAVILDKLSGKIYYDPRPFVTHNIKPLISHAADNGFPSEHTVAAMTLSTVLYFYRRKFAAIALALTLLIGIGRVAAHVHSPIDIVGGLIIGATAGITGYYLAPKFIKSSK